MRRIGSDPRSFRGIGARHVVAAVLLGLLLAGSGASPAGAIPPPQSGPVDLALDAQTGRLYTCLAYDNRILVMDVASGQLVNTITDVGITGNPAHGTAAAGVLSLALDEPLGRLFAINSAAREPEGQNWTLFAIDAAQGTILQQIPLGTSSARPYSYLLADPTHGKLYAVSETGTVVYDVETLTQQGMLSGGTQALLDREGGRLYLGSDGGIVVINTADDAALAELPWPEATPGWLALDPSRGRLYVIKAGTIHVLDTTTQQWLDPLMNTPQIHQAAAIDPADGELYIVVPTGEDEMTYHVFVLSHETGETRTTIDFKEPMPPEGYSCEAYPWIVVSKLVPHPAGGRIYGTGNSMGRCRPEAHLAFVLDTATEALVEWLPRLPLLPGTGGQRMSGEWLVLAGMGLVLSGILVSRLHRRRHCFSFPNTTILPSKNRMGKNQKMSPDNVP